MSLFRESRSSSPFPEPVVPPFPGVNVFGGTAAVNPSRALQSSAVWACTRLLSDSVAMMPVVEFTFNPDGSRRVLPASPLIKRPSATASMGDFIYMTMVSALLRGNAVGRKVAFDATGHATQIELKDPDQVSVRENRDTGALEWRMNGVIVPTREVFHIPAFRFPGSVAGLSPISYAATSIQTDAAIGDFAYGFFRDGAHPSAVLEAAGPINEDTARTIKARFKAAVHGRDVAVLGAGVTYRQIQIAPNESQFLEAQKYGVAEISRIFGVPPEMIAAEAGNSMTYANVEQRSLDFLTYSIQPWLSRIETALSAELPGNRHVRFDTSVLLRTDFETLMKATAIGVASKQMTPDEARKYRDAPPLTAEQKALLELVPLTVTPSGMPKATIKGAPPVAPVPVQPIEGEPAA